MSIRRIKNPQVLHPLADTDLPTVEMEWDEGARRWVAFVPELNGISTFGRSYEEALDNAAELITGWLAEMDEAGLKLPILRKKARQIIELLDM